MSRYGIERCYAIARLIQTRPVFTRAELNAWLAENRLQMCDKTINRDIEFLRNRLGYTLEFDFTLNQWRGRVPKRRVL